jgi:hypothetical protein
MRDGKKEIITINTPKTQTPYTAKDLNPKPKTQKWIKKKKKKKNLVSFISSLSLNAGSGHRGKRDRFKSETRIRSPKQNNKKYFLFVSQENKNYGEVHRKLATHGSDAL